MGAIVMDCSVLSSDTPKVRFHLSADTTSRDIVRKLLVSFDMASRDPRLFYISMEMTKGSSDNTIPGILSLKDDNRPLELSSNYRNSRFRIQMRSGGVVKVYDTCLVPNSFYKSMLISRKTTAVELVQLMLNYHKRTEDAADYVLVEIDEQQKELRVLKADDLPLLLTQMSKQNSSFQLRTAESVRAVSEKINSRLSAAESPNNSFGKKKNIRFHSDLQHEDEVQEWERDVAIAKLRTNLRQLEKEKGTIFYNKEPPPQTTTAKSSTSTIASGTKEFLKAKLEKLKLKRKSGSKKDENDNDTESSDSKLSLSTDTLDSSESRSSVQELESKLDELENSVSNRMDLGFSRNTSMRQSLPVRLHSDKRSLSDYIRKDGSEVPPERADLTAQYIERLRRKYTPDKAKALEDAKRLVGLSRSASMRSNLSRTSSMRSTRAENDTTDSSLRESLKLDLSSVDSDNGFLTSDRSSKSSRSALADPSRSARNRRDEKLDTRTPASARYSYDSDRKTESGYESRLSYTTYSGSSRSQDSSVTTPRDGSSLTTPRNDDSLLATPRGVDRSRGYPVTTPRSGVSTAAATPRGGAETMTTPRGEAVGVTTPTTPRRPRAESSPTASRKADPRTPRAEDPTTSRSLVSEPMTPRSRGLSDSSDPMTPRSRGLSEPMTPRSRRKFEESYPRTKIAKDVLETDLDADLIIEQRNKVNDEKTKLEQDTARRKAEVERLLKESQARKDAKLKELGAVRTNPDFVSGSGLSRSSSLRRSFRERERLSEERRQKLNRSLSDEAQRKEKTESTVSYTRRKYPDIESSIPKSIDSKGNERRPRLPSEEGKLSLENGHYDTNETPKSELTVIPTTKPSKVGIESTKVSSAYIKLSGTSSNLGSKESLPNLSQNDADIKTKKDLKEESPVAPPRAKPRKHENNKENVAENAIEPTLQTIEKIPSPEPKRSYSSFSREIENLKGAVGSAISVLANKVAARQNSTEKQEAKPSETEVLSTAEHEESSKTEISSPKDEEKQNVDGEKVAEISPNKPSIESVEEFLEDVDKKLADLKTKPENKVSAIEGKDDGISSTRTEIEIAQKSDNNTLTLDTEEGKKLSGEATSTEEFCSQSSEENDEWTLALEDVHEQEKSAETPVPKEPVEERKVSVEKSEVENETELYGIQDQSPTTEAVSEAVEEPEVVTPKPEEPSVPEVSNATVITDEGEDSDSDISSSDTVSSVREVLTKTETAFQRNDIPKKVSPKSASADEKENKDMNPTETQASPRTSPSENVEGAENQTSSENETESVSKSKAERPLVENVQKSTDQKSLIESVSMKSPIQTSKSLQQTVSKKSPVLRSPVDRSAVPKASVRKSTPLESPARKSSQKSPVHKSPSQKSPVHPQKSPVHKSPSQKSPIQNSPIQAVPTSSRAITKKEQTEEPLPSYLFQASQDEEKETVDALTLSSSSPIDDNFQKMLAEETEQQPPPTFPAMSLAEESQKSQKDEITLSQILDTPKKTEVDNGSPQDDSLDTILKTEEPVPYEVDLESKTETFETEKIASESDNLIENESRADSLEKLHQQREQRSEAREITERMRGFRRLTRSDEQWYADLKKLKNNGLWYGNRDPVPERKLSNEEEEEPIELRSKKVIHRKDHRSGRKSDNLDLHKSIARREERVRSRPNSQMDLIESRNSSRASSRASSRGASLLSEDGRPRTLEKSREIIAQILSPCRLEKEEKPKEIPRRTTASQTDNVVQKSMSTRNLSKPTFFTLLKECEIFEITIDTTGYPGHGLKLFESKFECGNNGRSPDGRKPAIGQRQGAFAKLQDRVLSVLCVDSINKKCRSLYQGRLQEGDYIVEVNGESCQSNDLTKVVAILEERRPCAVLELVVARRKLEDKTLSPARYPFSHLPDTDLEKQLVKLQLDSFNMRRDLQQKDKLIDELRKVMVKHIPVRQIKDGMKPGKFNINDLEEDSFFV